MVLNLKHISHGYSYLAFLVLCLSTPVSSLADQAADDLKKVNETCDIARYARGEAVQGGDGAVDRADEVYLQDLATYYLSKPGSSLFLQDIARAVINRCISQDTRLAKECAQGYIAIPFRTSQLVVRLDIDGDHKIDSLDLRNVASYFVKNYEGAQAAEVAAIFRMRQVALRLHLATNGAVRCSWKGNLAFKSIHELINWYR